MYSVTVYFSYKRKNQNRAKRQTIFIKMSHKRAIALMNIMIFTYFRSIESFHSIKCYHASRSHYGKYFQIYALFRMEQVTLNKYVNI